MVKVRINHPRTDPTGWIGAGIMAIFGGIAAFRWKEGRDLFFALLALRDLSGTYLLLSRKMARTRHTSTFVNGLSYVSSAVPLFYLGAESPIAASRFFIVQVLAILGFTLSTVALFELGSAFGISPANRGNVKSGVYRFVRHPMYLGYAIAEAGQIFFSPWNGLIFTVSCSLYVIRSKFENRLRA
jgi:protein-S-isoprenylcysteine O-methyltransferase Ste14